MINLCYFTGRLSDADFPPQNWDFYLVPPTQMHTTPKTTPQRVQQ